MHIDLDVAGPEECPGGFTPAPYWPPREHMLEAARETVQTMPVKVASLAVYRKRAQKAPVFQAVDEWAFLSGWLGCGE